MKCIWKGKGNGTIKKSTSVERVTRPSSNCSVHALIACLSDIGQIAWTKGSHPPKIYWLCNVRSRDTDPVQWILLLQDKQPSIQEGTAWMEDFLFSLLYSISSSFGGKWLEGRRVWCHFLAGKSKATGHCRSAGCSAMELTPPAPLPTTQEGAATAPACKPIFVSGGDVALTPALSRAPVAKTAGSVQLPSAPVRFPVEQSALTSTPVAAGNDSRDNTHPLLNELPTTPPWLMIPVLHLKQHLSSLVDMLVDHLTLVTPIVIIKIICELNAEERCCMVRMEVC
jgi:hypothetical protein